MYVPSACMCKGMRNTRATMRRGLLFFVFVYIASLVHRFVHFITWHYDYNDRHGFFRACSNTSRHRKSWQLERLPQGLLAKFRNVAEYFCLLCQTCPRNSPYEDSRLLARSCIELPSLCNFACRKSTVFHLETSAAPSLHTGGRNSTAPSHSACICSSPCSSRNPTADCSFRHTCPEDSPWRWRAPPPAPRTELLEEISSRVGNLDWVKRLFKWNWHSSCWGLPALPQIVLISVTEHDRNKLPICGSRNHSVAEYVLRYGATVRNALMRPGIFA